MSPADRFSMAIWAAVAVICVCGSLAPDHAPVRFAFAAVAGVAAGEIVYGILA